MILQFLMACAGMEYLPTPITVPIQQIFMHERNKYTIWELGVDGNIIESGAISRPEYGSIVPASYHGLSITVDDDSGGSYVVFLQGKRPRNWDLEPGDERLQLLIEIHVKDSSVVEGAGWSHGKFGSGQTIPMIK